jgi:hypothetical protein
LSITIAVGHLLHLVLSSGFFSQILSQVIVVEFSAVLAGHEPETTHSYALPVVDMNSVARHTFPVTHCLYPDTVLNTQFLVQMKPVRGKAKSPPQVA